MRAAVYAKAALADQDCRVQLKDLREFCAHRGWQVVEEYVDVGARKTKASRAGLDRLLRDAGGKHFECVLVCRLDRFGASLVQTIAHVAALTRLGVRFLATRQLLDTKGWTCTQWNILSAAAEFERQEFSEKIKVGMTAAKQQGKRIGRPSLSFDRHKAQTMRAAGASIRKIGTTLAVSPTTIRRFTSASEEGTPLAS